MLLDDGTTMTGGYYDVSGHGWSKYINPGETILCDSCMWHDERYLADYPYMRGVVS